MADFAHPAPHGDPVAMRGRHVRAVCQD
jgi:hypothetical protein